ncbi:MAG: phosphate ABC transporter substrate-binding protein [Flavobacteriales bacterium]|nr:MAG: phosphate ABC transporter substrate-binding protein [Flavobacteriales bacterium]
MKKIAYLLGAFLLLYACQKKEEQKKEDYYIGEISISTDDSFFSVTEALGESYQYHYPDANIKVIKEREDVGFLNLLNQKVDAIVMSRDLSEKEKSEYERIIDLPFQPAKFAGDAVLFVVPKNSEREQVSMDEIVKALHADKKEIIFDGTNSSNLNFVAQVLNEKPSDLSFGIIKGNERLIEKLEKFPNRIGVIALNSISRIHSKKVKELRSKIKILPIEKDGELHTPTHANIRNMSYPFTRIAYFLTREGHFGMANGFIRFSCTDIGQKVVEKEGLQKYYLYKRQVEMR